MEIWPILARMIAGGVSVEDSALLEVAPSLADNWASRVFSSSCRQAYSMLEGRDPSAVYCALCPGMPIRCRQPCLRFWRALRHGEALSRPNRLSHSAAAPKSFFLLLRRATVATKRCAGVSPATPGLGAQQAPHGFQPCLVGSSTCATTPAHLWPLLAARPRLARKRAFQEGNPKLRLRPGYRQVRCE